MRRRTVGWAGVVTILAIVAMYPGGARADFLPFTIDVQNPGFEAQTVPEGTSVAGVISGWVLDSPPGAGSVGVYNPTPVQFSDAEMVDHGTNVAYSNGPFVTASGTPYSRAISQTLGAVLEVNTRYFLTVDVGFRADMPGKGFSFPGYEVALLAGGTAIAWDSSLVPTAGEFLTSDVTYWALAGDPHLGDTLSIRLLSKGIQVNFDDVGLWAVDPPPPTAEAAAEPASLLLITLGLGGAAVMSRRGKHLLPWRADRAAIAAG